MSFFFPRSSICHGFDALELKDVWKYWIEPENQLATLRFLAQVGEARYRSGVMIANRFRNVPEHEISYWRFEYPLEVSPSLEGGKISSIERLLEQFYPDLIHLGNFCGAWKRFDLENYSHLNPRQGIQFDTQVICGFLAYLIPKRRGKFLNLVAQLAEYSYRKGVNHGLKYPIQNAEKAIDWWCIPLRRSPGLNGDECLSFERLLKTHEKDLKCIGLTEPELVIPAVLQKSVRR